MPARSQQAELMKGRSVKVDVGILGRIAPIAGVSKPDIVMSPDSPTGLPSTGFAFFLYSANLPFAFPVLGILTTVWLHNPTNDRWGSFASILVLEGALMRSFDIDAAELYFQFGAPLVAGSLEISFCEL